MRPAFETMSGAQLLAEYNRLTGRGRQSPFQNKQAALAACIAAWEASVPAEPPVRVANGTGHRATDLRREVRIRVRENPYKPGSKGWLHFVALQLHPVKGDYLDHISAENDRARRDARQWLYNMQKANHVEVM